MPHVTTILQILIIELQKQSPFTYRVVSSFCEQIVR